VERRIKQSSEGLKITRKQQEDILRKSDYYWSILVFSNTYRNPYEGHKKRRP